MRGRLAGGTQSAEESSIGVPFARGPPMPVFWMTYKTAMGNPIGVLIMEAPDLLHARFRAEIFELPRGAEFAEAYPLDPQMMKHIPERLIGRMIPLAMAADLLKQIEHADPTPKRPPDRSVRKRTAPRRRRGA